MADSIRALIADDDMADSIRVLIADDDPLVRVGLSLVLGAAPEVVIVGEAGDGAEAITMARELKPDVVLMDVRMPRTDGLAATEALRRDGPEPAIIVLTTFDTDEYLLGALRLGANGFLLKDIAPTEILNAVRRAAAGESILAPAVVPRLIDYAVGRTSGGPADVAGAQGGGDAEGGGVQGGGGAQGGGDGDGAQDSGHGRGGGAIRGGDGGAQGGGHGRAQGGGDGRGDGVVRSGDGVVRSDDGVVHSGGHGGSDPHIGDHGGFGNGYGYADGRGDGYGSGTGDGCRGGTGDGDSAGRGYQSSGVPGDQRRGRVRAAESVRRARAVARLRRLSERERIVAEAVATGRSNAEISADLHMSVPTVKAYVSRLLDKLGCANRVQIAILIHEAR